MLDQVEDTVWLSAHAHNRCAPQEGIKQRYWLVCSFYGVDENAGTEASRFDVVPNPNNGQMTLNFEHLTGKIDCKVYDMRGVLIDNIQTFNTIDSYSLTYDMNKRAEGLYLFVATGKEGTVSKKVVIQP